MDVLRTIRARTVWVMMVGGWLTADVPSLYIQLSYVRMPRFWLTCET